jgi:hypothetical protein
MISWIKDHLGWFLGSLILLVICIFLLYSWIDSRVTIEYVLQEQKNQRREIEVLQSLLLETGRRMSRSEIEQLVTKRIGENRIKKEAQDELSIDGGIILKFRGDSLVEVKSMNE